MKTKLLKPIIIMQVFLAIQSSACAKSVIKQQPSVDKPIDTTVNRKLIWSDEFNGTKVDETKWNIIHQVRRTDPDGKDAWWHRDNAYAENGNLVIRTSKIDGAYAGAAINTKDKFERAYGYYEIKAKLQKEQGHWGAFWLFSQSVNTIGNEGKDGTEIDVFESPWVGLGIDKVQSALHYDGYAAAHKKLGNPITGMKMNDGNWHIFAVEWTPEKYKFYYDEKLVWETDFGGVSAAKQYMIISDEVGDWGKILDIRKANLPDYMLIDYVRVYDRK